MGGKVGASSSRCSGNCGGLGRLRPGVGCSPADVRVGRRIPVVAGCDEREGAGCWTGAGTISGESGGFAENEGSNPVFAVDCGVVGNRVPNDAFSSVGIVGDHIFGGGDAVHTSDDEGSPENTLERFRWRERVSGAPSVVSAGELKLPCLD